MVQYLAHSANRLRMITAVFGSPSPNIPLDGRQVLRKNTLWVVENTFIGDVMQISEVGRSFECGIAKSIRQRSMIRKPANTTALDSST